MGITYGDYLIDSGYYDITPEQEREFGCLICNGDCSASPGGPPYNCPMYYRIEEAMTADEIETLKHERDTLRKALYELLYVSFPPVGSDAPRLVTKHHEAVRAGCHLLGITTDGLDHSRVLAKIDGEVVCDERGNWVEIKPHTRS